MEEKEKHLFEVYKLEFQHTEQEVGSLWQRNGSYLIANSFLAILVSQLTDYPALLAAITAFCGYSFCYMAPSKYPLI